MTKDTSKTLTLKPSSELQEKVQELKKHYEQGQQATQKLISKKDKSLPSKKILPQASSSQACDTNKAALETKKVIYDSQKEQREAKRKSFMQMKQALTWIMETYPHCFNKDEPKPLKIRIEKDILANLPPDLPFSRLNIRKAIGYYTHSPKYRQALIDRSHRYDLQGNPGEEIKQDHQQLAQEQLDIYLIRKKARLDNKKQFSKKQHPKDETLQKCSMPEK